MPLRRALLVLAASLLMLTVAISTSNASVHTADSGTDTVDEIHYDYGEAAGSVRVYWHGAEDTIYYGPDTSYGEQATASVSPVTPVDMAGPFMRVTLSDL